MKEITSINNELIKELSKLKQKKYRDLRKEFLVEGYHLVEEAKDHLKMVLICDKKDEVKGVTNILVTKEIIKKLSLTEAPQSIIGLCDYFGEAKIEGAKRIIVLDDLQDPGNVGTIIRSSLGFKIDLVIMSKGSVDLYNDKVIRSTQGAIFKVKVIEKDLKEALKEIKQEGIKVFGTSLKNGEPLEGFGKIESYAIVLGNEGNGVSEEILNLCDRNIFIEMDRDLESLNVGVSAGIIMHHFYKYLD